MTSTLVSLFIMESCNSLFLPFFLFVCSYFLIVAMVTSRGQVPAEAEANFLKKASTLDTYGVDPHKVKVSMSEWKKLIDLQLQKKKLFRLLELNTWDVTALYMWLISLPNFVSCDLLKILIIHVVYKCNILFYNQHL